MTVTTEHAKMLKRGPFAERPVATVGRYWYLSDEGGLYKSNGSTWTTVSAPGGGGSPTGSAGGVLDGTYPNPGLAAGVAGAGLAETSDVLSVNVDASTIEINSDMLRVKADGITANEIATGAVGASELASTAVTPGTYGDATHVPQVTIDEDGRVTTAADVAITGTGGADPAWMIDIPTVLTPASQTNWANFASDAAYWGYYFRYSTGAQNAELTWPIVLGAGTWNVTLLGPTYVDAGIVSIQLDGSEVATVDMYSAGFVANAQSTVTGISVASTSKKVLKLKMATKNASSSSYFGRVMLVRWLRTA